MSTSLFCYVYVLRSRLDSHHYVGLTRDLRERLREHRDGRVLSTRDRRPLELVYYEHAATFAMQPAARRTSRPLGDGIKVLEYNKLVSEELEKKAVMMKKALRISAFAALLVVAP
jgi:predicted GIY-YIG superfamily endonuclease